MGPEPQVGVPGLGCAPRVLEWPERRAVGHRRAVVMRPRRVGRRWRRSTAQSAAGRRRLASLAVERRARPSGVRGAQTYDVALAIRQPEGTCVGERRDLQGRLGLVGAPGPAVEASATRTVCHDCHVLASPDGSRPSIGRSAPVRRCARRSGSPSTGTALSGGILAPCRSCPGRTAGGAACRRAGGDHDNLRRGRRVPTRARRRRARGPGRL